MSINNRDFDLDNEHVLNIILRSGAQMQFFFRGVSARRTDFFHQGPTSRLVQTTYYYDLIE